MNTEILKIITKWNIEKFSKVYDSIKDENQKQQIKNWFDSHMKEIAIFCNNNFDKNNLTENFIKNLHKIHYPKWYKIFKKTKDWKWEVCTMIPWQYKTLMNFKWVKPENVKKEMSILIENYNTNIKSTDNKFDLITKFIIDFFRIHPFGDWNWTVAFILYDLLLLNNNLKPLYIKEKYINTDNKKEIYKAIEKSISENNISFFKKSINQN